MRTTKNIQKHPVHASYRDFKNGRNLFKRYVPWIPGFYVGNPHLSTPLRPRNQISVKLRSEEQEDRPFRAVRGVEEIILLQSRSGGT